MKARSQEGTFMNSHYHERTCRQPFQPFDEECTLYFGDYSGLWPTDDYHVTLRKNARKYISWSRKYKRAFDLVATTNPKGDKLHTYRAEFQSAPSDPRIFMNEYTVSADATLHRYGKGLSDRSATVTTELFGFGEKVTLPTDPLNGER